MSPISQNDLTQLTSAITSSMTAGFAQLQTALISTIQQTQVVVTPKAAAKPFLPKGAKADASSLASKDAMIVAAFHRKGFKDVVLMNRSDKSAPFNVKPFKAWVAEGRIPRKGSKSVRGLFHISQCDLIAKPTGKAAKAKAKAA